MAPEQMDAGFGIYIHWPFCQAKCPYCDFNSHVSDEIDIQRWRDAYLSELRRYGSETNDRVVQSIFFGGGTPSLMPPDLVSDIIGEIRRQWRTTNDVEITLEANPTSSEAGKFRGFADGGVNRLSMGIQALNDDDLKKLGRLHTVAEARDAFDIAKASFDQVSFDLIYARQDQPLENWKTELTEALSMGADHLSLYQLTIEPGTAFGARFALNRLPGLPDDDVAADMYALTQDLTSEHNMGAYEISNHATEGHQSRHNLVYWRGGEYLGIGPGAHGRMGTKDARVATHTYLNPSEWLDAVSRSGTGDLPRTTVSQSEQLTEYLMMSLRLAEGCELTRFDIPDELSFNINGLLASGHLTRAGNKIRVAPEYRIILNAILRDILV